MWAAQTNTTPSLFWALFYILKNREVQHQIMEEFKALLKSKTHETNLDDVNNNEPERKISLDDVLNLEKNNLDKLVLLGELEFILIFFLTFIIKVIPNYSKFSCDIFMSLKR